MKMKVQVILDFREQIPPYFGSAVYIRKDYSPVLPNIPPPSAYAE
jgi:hypothetical protein